jgi:hypothetical protein
MRRDLSKRRQEFSDDRGGRVEALCQDLELRSRAGKDRTHRLRIMNFGGTASSLKKPCLEDWHRPDSDKVNVRNTALIYTPSNLSIDPPVNPFHDQVTRCDIPLFCIYLSIAVNANRRISLSSSQTSSHVTTPQSCRTQMASKNQVRELNSAG